MKKRNNLIWWIIGILVIIILAFLFIKYTGYAVNTTSSSRGVAWGRIYTTYYCKDTDKGKDYGIRGRIMVRNILAWEDYCYNTKSLYEGYCEYRKDSVKALIRVELHDCPGGCDKGACKACIPNCAGKQCGDDGCSGSCGTCSNGKVCSDGQCIGGNVSITESVNLATSTRKIYFGDAINVARVSLTSTELPNLLSDSKFIDSSGVQYTYTQTINPGSASISFGTSGGDLADPVLYIDGGNVGSLTPGWLYKYKLSFAKNLNLADSVNIQGQKIKILGKDYLIAPGSTNSNLFLYGSGENVVVKGSQVKTINGVSHNIELVTTSDSSHGTIKVDGVSKSVVEGNTYAFAGNFNIYIKDIKHPAKIGDTRQVELIIGSDIILLTNGQTVKKGADQTAVKGTLATIDSTSNGVSGFSVAVGMQKTQTDSIAEGQSFSDPVFGGFKLQFASVNPKLDDGSRDKVIVNTDNNQYAYISFTSARDGGKGQQKLTYAYDKDTSSIAVNPILAHTIVTSNNKGRVHVLEGENAQQNDWIVINQGDVGTILSVDDISVDTDTEATVTFSDVITGDSQKITLTKSSGVYQKTGVNFFGGNNYKIYINALGTNVNISWSADGIRTLFPRIKLKGGGWIAFLTETSVSSGTKIIFPDGQTTLATSGVNTVDGANLVNGIKWNVNQGSVNSILEPTCNFNSAKGHAILIIEPKKFDDISYGNFICIPMTTTGTTEIAIARAVINGINSGFVSLSSDNYKSRAVDKFGAFITDEQRTNENGVEIITYPASQMFFDVSISSE